MLVKHGKRGDVPRVPTKSESQTKSRQQTLELLSGRPEESLIAVGRSAFDLGQFIRRGMEAVETIEILHGHEYDPIRKHEHFRFRKMMPEGIAGG